MPTLLGELLGKVESAARPADSTSAAESPQQTAESLADEINRVISPPVPVTPESIHIRAMEVVSDAINEHGGRFSADEFGQLCELIIDSPVLVAHDKRQLPVARNFKAEVIQRDNNQWVKVWFYWPKDTAGAEDLAARIDSGVLREVSIGFEFTRPECSVCGGDMRTCDHQPFTDYQHLDGHTRSAHFIYRGLVRVLETSLVYRGATPGTRIGAGLFFANGEITKSETTTKPEPPTGTSPLSRAQQLFAAGLSIGTAVFAGDQLTRLCQHGKRYVVTPTMEGLPLVAMKWEDELFLLDAKNQRINDRLPELVAELIRLMPDNTALFGWLVNPKRTQKKPSHHFSIEWIRSIGTSEEIPPTIEEQRRYISKCFNSGKTIRPVPYRIVAQNQVVRAVELLASPSGCRLFDADSCVTSRLEFLDFRRTPLVWLTVTDRTTDRDGWRYTLACSDGRDIHEIGESINTAHRYDIGDIVPVTVKQDNAQLTIRYSPALRQEPDAIAVWNKVKQIKWNEMRT